MKMHRGFQIFSGMFCLSGKAVRQSCATGENGRRGTAKTGYTWFCSRKAMTLLMLRLPDRLPIVA
jgi:hypothetical protein